MSLDRMPGALILGRPPVGCVAVILINDLWLKKAYAGWLSGKLSDLAICFLLPVWLYALVEVVWAGTGLADREWPGHLERPHRWLIGACCLIAVAYFAGLQLSVAWARWHVDTLEALFGVSFVATPDPSDLIALAVVPLAGWYLYERVPPNKSSSE